MIAFGTCKKKSAFKLYARAQNMDFALANTISNQISDYEEAMKYASDEDADTIDIYDYVDKQYEDYIEKSKKYWGIIMDKKKAPCAFLLYSGNIKEEIGLIKCKSESTGKEFITAVIDGAIAENYKFLKNDILTVSVVLLVKKIFDKIGITPFSVNKLRSLIKLDNKTWDVYANGYTIGVNQCERESSAKKMMKYKATNESELAAWIAGIRPAFKSMYDKFESREHFDYGIPAFDKLLQTKEMPNSFILYQEQTMSVLNYAGFPLDECYGIIKAIAKKHPEKVKPLKSRFLDGFKNKLIEDDKLDEAKATETSSHVWEIIENSCGYGFNSAHAYCMALDSLYCAYLKSHYPYAFYEVLLNFHSDRGEKDKVLLLKQEMEDGFGIKEGEYKFGEDNRRFVGVPERGIVTPSLVSLKGFSQKVANSLYKMAVSNVFDDFYSVLEYIKTNSVVDKSQLEILIKIDYFDKFGNSAELLKMVDIFNDYYGKSQIKKEKTTILPGILRQYASKETDKTFFFTTMEPLIRFLFSQVKEQDFDVFKKVLMQVKYLGKSYIKCNFTCKYGIILGVDTKYSPKLSVYDFNTNTKLVVKMQKKEYENKQINIGDIVSYTLIYKYKYKKVDDNWVQDTTVTEPWFSSIVIKKHENLED